MSYLGAAICIISTAQHAKPKVIGHKEVLRPQFRRSSNLATAQSTFPEISNVLMMIGKYFRYLWVRMVNKGAIRLVCVPFPDEGGDGYHKQKAEACFRYNMFASSGFVGAWKALIVLLVSTSEFDVYVIGESCVLVVCQFLSIFSKEL